MENTLTMILPEPYSRTDLFELVAKVHKYNATITETTTSDITYAISSYVDSEGNTYPPIPENISGLKIIEKEEIGAMDEEKTLARIVVRETETITIQNPQTLEEFAKGKLWGHLLSLVNSLKKASKEDEINEAISTIQGVDISGGEIL